MSRVGLERNKIIAHAAQMANETGLDQVSLKVLAQELGVKSPSLYNHIKGLEDLKRGIMLYGWRQMTERIGTSVIGVSGHEAIRNICYAFYEYATENPGIFNAMLWYNKYEDEETNDVTGELFGVLFEITASLHISEENCNHFIRTLRGLLQGFSMLVINGAFGNPVSIAESFEISVKVMIEGMKVLEEEDKNTSGLQSE